MGVTRRYKILLKKKEGIMKFIKISDTAIEWILENGEHIVKYGLEGIDGDDAIIDVVRPDSPLYRYVCSTIMFIRSLVGIVKNMPMITEE
jgi:hypothetical protein